MLTSVYILLITLLSLPLTVTAVHAQSAQLLEAAKKEGKAVIYGSLEGDTMDAIMQGFKKKTGIDAEYWRASATKVMDRAMTEFRAGKTVRRCHCRRRQRHASDATRRLLSKVRFADQQRNFPRKSSIPTSGRATATSSSASSTINRR